MRSLVAEEQVVEHLDLEVGLRFPGGRAVLENFVLEAAHVTAQIFKRVDQAEVGQDLQQASTQAVAAGIVAAIGGAAALQVLGTDGRSPEDVFALVVVSVKHPAGY